MLALTKTDVGLSNVTNNAQYYPGGTDVALSDFTGGTAGYFLRGNGASAPSYAILNQAAVSGLTASSTPNFTGSNMYGNLVMTGSTNNIRLNSNWLSGDGQDEGVYVLANGNVGIGNSSASIYQLTVGPNQEFKMDSSGNIATAGTINVGTPSSKIGVIVLSDSDGEGYTYVTGNNGTLSASVTNPGCGTTHACVQAGSN
jgi:hypothetical protein